MPPAVPRSRTEQLRLAKQAQRARDSANGLVPCQIKLPRETARRLREALAVPGMIDALETFLDQAIIDANAYPNLRLLVWNRARPRLTARDAFSLYENNWRLVDQTTMTDAERTLIRSLADRFGRGVLNA